MESWNKLIGLLPSELPANILAPVLDSLRPTLLKPDHLHLELMNPALMPIARRLQEPLRQQWQKMMGPTADVAIALGGSAAFSDLLTGRANQPAIQSLKRWVHADHSVLFLSGPPQTGKSRLLQATREARESCGQQVFAHSLPDLALLFSGAKKTADDLIQRWQKSQAFALDDLHLYDRTPASFQSRFSNVLEMMLESGKSAHLTSRLPLERLALPERLLSRLRMALPVRLELPDNALKSAYLARLYEEYGLGEPSPEVLVGLAGARNFHEIQLLFHDDFFGRRQQEQTPGLPGFTIPVDDIIRVVAEHHNLSPEAILGPSRQSEIIPARHLAMYLALQHSGWNKSALARAFGRTDHTTITHAYRKIAADIKAGRHTGIDAVMEKLRTIIHKADSTVDI